MKFHYARGILPLLIVFLGKNAMALEQPSGASQDRRMKVVDYDERNVVAVDVSLSNATQITFGGGEEVLDIASGFSQGWEFVNRRNHLYLKARSIKSADGAVLLPAPGQWDTNLIVTTTAHVYTFQLNARAERIDKRLGYDPSIAFRVEFRYPAEEARRAQQETIAKATKKALNRKAPPRNWNYSMQVGPSSDNIVPDMAYDDGAFTYLRFHMNREFPSVFLAVGGQESIVNTHVDPDVPDVLVIQRVAERFTLRLGSAVVAIFNEGFDPKGRSVREYQVELPNGSMGTYGEISAPTESLSTGTTIPGVRRTVRDAPAAAATAPNVPAQRPTGANAETIRAVQENLLLLQTRSTEASK